MGVAMVMPTRAIMAYMTLALTDPSIPCYTPPVQIKVCVVEDNAGIRESVEQLLSRAKGFCCLGLYADPRAALAEIPQRKPDVVLMDINMPGMSGIECARSLKAVLPAVRIVMFTVYEEPEQLFKALTAGASGYLLKRTPPQKLLESIREAHLGGAPMTRQMACKVVEYFHHLKAAPPEIEKLSPREHEALTLLADGFRYKEIADKMGLSLDTVREYVGNIYRKLHVTSRTEAVVKYLQNRTG